MVWAVELPAHASLDKIQVMPRIMQDFAVIDHRAQPGIDPQPARVAVAALGVIGDIQVELVRHADDFALHVRRFAVHTDQVHVSGVS